MTKPFPLVYIVVLNYNGRTVLEETLETISAMQYPNAKLVVVDNASIDGSAEIVRERFPSAILIVNDTNLGFGEGNNVGMQYALDGGAEWIFLVNNDIVADRELLTELVRAGESDPSIGILGPKIYYYNRNAVLWYAGGTVNFWTGIISHRGVRTKDRGQFDRVEDTGYVSGCAMLIRRLVLDQVAMFDPVYSPAYTEDADLCERTRRAGYRLVYVPTARLWHKVSSSSGGGMTPFKTQLKVEHNLIFMKRYARWYQWLTIPWFVGGSMVVFVLKELSKGNFEVLRAFTRGFLRAIRRLF